MELNSIQKIRLDNLNRGFNFDNLKHTERNCYVEVMLKTKQNLKESEEELQVKNTLFSSWRGEDSLEEFFKELEEFVNKPYLVIKGFNRKTERGYGEYNSINNHFRDEEDLVFEDIHFIIGELANLKLRDLNLDFIEKVKELLSKQRNADEETKKLVDRYVYLKEQTQTLKSCLGIKKESYSYSSKKEDETMKMVLLTAEQYNERLKKIEKEIREIAKQLKIEVSEYDFKYIAIPKKVSLKKWVEVNEESLQESWESFDEEQQAEEGDFKKFAEKMYDESNGEIIEEAEDEDSEE